MSKFFPLFAIVILVLTGTNASYGQDKAESAKVAVPLITQLVKQKENGGWSGPLIDVLKKVGSQSDINFDMKVVPFKRAVAMTKEGAADFGVFMESPTRNKMAMPVLNLGDAVFVVVSLKGAPITSLDQLSNKLVARIRGGTAIKSLSAIPDMQFHFFNTHEDGMRLLLGNRVDALITADFRVLEAIERLKLSLDDFAPPIPIEKRELWLYWSWKSQLEFDTIRTIKQTPAVALDYLGTSPLFQYDLKNVH